jgi:hypothetical protein
MVGSLINIGLPNAEKAVAWNGEIKTLWHGCPMVKRDIPDYTLCKYKLATENIIV